MAEPVEYAAGGYIPTPQDAPPVVMRLDSDECIVVPTSHRTGECIRGDHPTDTSDCTTEPWITHRDSRPR